MFAPDGEKCFGFLCGLKYLFSLCIGNDFVFGTVDDEFGDTGDGGDICVGGIGKYQIRFYRFPLFFRYIL